MEFQWPLILFTFFLCLGGGMMLFQGILALKGKGARMNQPVAVTSVALVAIGGICAFFHLQHWERLFNGFGHITSGITIELIFTALFVVAAIIMFAVARKDKEAPLPEWCAIVTITFSALMVLAMSLSYLMASRPAWDNIGLVAFYLADTMLFGSFAMMAVAKALRCDEECAELRKWVLASAIVGVAGFLLYALCACMSSGNFSNVGHYYDPTDSTVEIIDIAQIASIMTAGTGATYFWGGIVLGAAAPLAIAVALQKVKNESSVLPLAVSGLACAVAGSILFRCLIYTLGYSLFNIF